jgi:hypothetical protein
LGVSGNATITGNLTVNGTTTTVSTTNTTVEDQLLELGTGRTGAPTGDCGIIIERGDSNNAFIGYDESADKFILATTTATGASTGDLTLTQATLLADVQGTVTGNASSASTAAALDVGNASSNSTYYLTFVDNNGGSKSVSIDSGGALQYNPSTNKLKAGIFEGRLANIPASNKTSAYNVVGTDAGTMVRTTSNCTIMAGEFDAGDIISIYNNSGSDISILADGGVTLRKVGDAGTGTRTLAQRGLMTVTCVSSNEFVCSGGGMS